MIRTLLVASGIILLALAAWLVVQAGARRLAARHPELGPAREPDAHGCSGCADVQGCTNPAPRGTRDWRRGCVNDRTDCERKQKF